MLDSTGYSVLTHIYDAAVDGSLWGEAMDAVAMACDVRVAAYFSRHPDAHIRDFLALSTRLAHASRTPWSMIFGIRQGQVQVSDWDQLRRVAQGQPQLDTAFGTPASILDQRPDYRFLKRRLQIGRRVGVRLSTDSAWFEAMGLGLGDHQAELDLSQQRVLATLVPHISKAAEMSRLFSLLNARFGRVLGALDQVRIGCAIVRQTGEVIATNAEARRIFGQKQALRQTGNGHLRCHLPHQTARLYAAFVEAVHASAGLGLRPAFEINIVAPNSKLPLLAEVAPLRDTLHELDGEQEAALLTIIDPERPDVLNIKRFCLSYGLTPAEAALCSTIMQGKGAAQPGLDNEAHDQSPASQIAALFRVTGVSDRMALMRRIAKVAPPVGNTSLPIT